MRTVLLIATLAMLASSCTLTGPGKITEITELEDARDRWERLGLDDYDIEMSRSCFCIGAGQLTVHVRDDTVAAVREHNTYWSSNEDWWQYIPTIDGLFDIVEEAAASADSFIVEYSEEQGYPTTVSIDWYADAVDDEIAYSVQSVDPAVDTDIVVLRLAEKVTLDSGVSVRFDSVDEDSRCPRGVDCIWAGRAIVTVSVTQNGETHRLTLVDGETIGADESAEATIGSIHVALLLVSPYPGIDAIPSGDYRIRLVVTSN